MQDQELTNHILKRMLRAAAVAVKLGVGEATLWRWASLGHFPKPLILSPGVSAWYEHEIDAWLAERARLRDVEDTAEGHAA